MTKNSLLLAGLTLALALVGFLLFSGEDGTTHTEVMAESPVTPQAPVEQEQALTPALVSDGTQLTHATEVEESGLSRVQREEVVAAIPEGTLELLVRGPNGPVAGAEVLVHADADSDRSSRFRHSGDPDALMAEAGMRLTANAEGLVRVPRSTEGYTLVVGSHEGLWGLLIIDSKLEERQTLELARDLELRVQVLNAGNEPVSGVEVMLREVRPNYSRTIQAVKTEGPEGIATIRHAQRHFKEAKEAKEQASYSFELDVLTLEPITAAIDPAQPGSELYTLVLPATGRVEVSLVDEAWEPILVNGDVNLALIAPGERKDHSPFSHRNRRSVTVQVEDGKAKFEFVEVGRELVAAGRRHRSNVRTRVYATGPQREGELVTMEVRLGVDHPVARLRALDADGSAFASKPLLLNLSQRDQFTSNSSSARVSTDSGGYFVVDLEPWVEGMTLELDVADSNPEGGPKRVGHVDLSRKLELGLNELGDVVLGPPPIFVQGRCVTQAGDPVPRVELALQRSDQEGRGTQRDHNFRHTTEADGTFEIEGAPTGHGLQLAGTKDGYACVWHDFTPGQRGLVLVMQTEGRIAGKVLLDESIPADKITIGIDALQEQKEFLDWGRTTMHPEEDGSFVMAGLMPGVRKVTVQISSQRGAVLRLDDVEVRAGETTRDPRLAAIDLRGKLWLHELTLQGATESERIQGSVRFGPSGAEELENSTWTSENPIRLVSETEFVDVVISAAGYRSEQLTNHTGKATVKLRQGMTVTIVLTGDAKIPDPPVHVKAVLVNPEGGHDSIDWGGDAFDEERTIQSRVKTPGRLRVEWLVERRSSGSSIATSVKLDREQLVDVEDIASGQRVEVSLTQEEMDEIVSHLN